MSQLVTRCPHCSTSFHVNEQQLRAARGAVRCGSCLQVFRADENIVFSDGEAETERELEALLEDDDILIHDDMDNTPDDEDTAPPAPTPESGNQPDQGAEDSLIGDAFGDSQWQDIATGTDDADDDDDIDESAVLLPDPDDDPWNIGDAHEAPPKPESAASELWDRQQQKPRDRLTGQLHGTEAHASPGEAISPGDPGIYPGRDRLISAIEPAPVEMDWQPRRDRRMPGWCWPLLALLLAVGIAAQVAVFRFDSLSKREPWRGLYATACPLLGCQLPPQLDLKAIRTSNLVVRSHSKIAGALVVDAVLQNTAPFAQPFPSLDLNFTDLKNRPVASRRFEPRDYLQGELAGRRQMPSGSPVHIAIEIADPGSEAVNYELHIAR